MDKKIDNTANQIVQEGRLEDDARRAKQLLEEHANWNAKAQAFIKSAGAPAQEPTNFLRNVLLIYASKKLESGIITPN